MTRLPHHARAAVLLEVVLALAIFLMAATVIQMALSESLTGTRRLEREAVAEDLAVSVLSDLWMWPDTVSASEPTSFEEQDEALADWTWQVETDEQALGGGDLPEMVRVTVTIRHTPSGYTRRLSQLLPTAGQASEERFAAGRQR